MAVRYLLDTNICIYIRQQRLPKLLARFRKLSPGEAGISIITYGELHYGAEKSPAADRARRELNVLMSALPVLPLPATAGAFYGEIRADLSKRGEIIGANDLWIAAHARASNLILVTNNEREFQRVGGLNIENWAG